MGTTVNFSGSSRRHYSDAKLLLANDRLPNAGHLFGFAAECGLKALLIAHGLKTNPATGDIVEAHPYKYRTHISVLINSVQTFSSSRIYSKYLGMMPNLRLFSNWDTSHRYWDESSLPASHEDWNKAAEEVMRMLEQAILDGVVP